MTNELTIKEPTQLVTTNPDMEVEFASKAAKALKSIVDNKKKKVMINGEQYIEFEDWQTLARFFNYTVGSKWVKVVMRDNKVFGYDAMAVVYNQKGKVIGSAEASCFRDERNWGSKPEFQLKSMAQTRASAKALRNILAWVSVLAGYKPTPAEEMDGVQGGSNDKNASGGHTGGNSTGAEPEDMGNCVKCGAPLRLSKAGSKYCSALCWKSPIQEPTTDDNEVTFINKGKV